MPQAYVCVHLVEREIKAAYVCFPTRVPVADSLAKERRIRHGGKFVSGNQGRRATTDFLWENRNATANATFFIVRFLRLIARNSNLYFSEPGLRQMWRVDKT
jgi:hypothetical protein